MIFIIFCAPVKSIQSPFILLILSFPINGYYMPERLEN